MARTNIDINERLVRKVMRLYGLASKRAAVDFALRRLAGASDPRDVLRFEGSGWEGDLDRMRRWEPPAWDGPGR
jgi:Arc/MetJ family transcription regulator